MLASTNYVALVGGGRNPKFPQTKVIIWDDLKSKTALEITTLTAVRGVALSRRRVAVVLQNSVRVYAFEKQPTPLAKFETADNMNGLVALSDKWLVFPGRTAGQLMVVDLATDNVSIIPAHNSSLQALALSADGEFIATASEKGTIVRIYATSNCARVCERRRGSEFAAIFSLRFSPSGRMLACTSAKGTLHIFDVSAQNKKGAPTSPGRTSTPPHSPGVAPPSGGSGMESTNKWGLLKNIPIGPFSDTYSFAVEKFETGDEPKSNLSEAAVLGTSKPAKGIIGWIDEDSLVVVGAGRDAKWEKFIFSDDPDGRKTLRREGWKRYLNA
jgi:WD repeat-containing protein 45